MLDRTPSVSISSEMNRTSGEGLAPPPSCQTLGPPPPSPDGYTTMKPCSSATRFHWLVSFCAAPHLPPPRRLMTSAVGFLPPYLLGTWSTDSRLCPEVTNTPFGRFDTFNHTASPRANHT